MSFSDPITITINAVPVSFTRLSTRDMGATYSSADGLRQLDVDHSFIGKSKKGGKSSVLRSRFTLTTLKWSSDPAKPAENLSVEARTTITITRPWSSGFTNTEMVNDFAGVATYLTATSNANYTKFVQRES